MRMLTASERQRELDMMTTPGRWPRWPFLPVKRRKDFMECGFIYADDPGEGAVRVWVHSEDRGHPTIALAVHLSTVPVGQEAVQPDHRYTDVYALLDDGWVVD